MGANEEEKPTAASLGAVEENAPPKTSEFSTRSVMVLLAISLSMFNTAGMQNAFGVFEAYYTTQYLRNESSFQISWIGSFSIFLFFMLGPPAGMLSDKLGPRIPIAIGAVCQVLALFMVSLCKQYYQFFLAQGVLLGIGMAFIALPALSVSPLYFQRNRGLAQGIGIAGSSLGGVLWPITLDQLLYHDNVSFGWTIRIVAFMQLALLTIVIIGVQRPQKPKVADKSAVVEAVQAETPAVDEKKEQAKKRKEDLARLKHPSFLLMCGGLAIYYFGFFTPFFYITTYGISLGITEAFSIYLISILNAASFFGRILPGFVADRVGHFNVIVVAMFGSCIVCFCWTAVTSVAGIIVWAIAYGFVSGAVLSLQMACVSKIATRETMGTAFGLLMASIALTCLFGTPIAGELVKRGYIALSMFSSATMLVGGSFVAAARFAWDRRLLAVA